MPDYRLGQAAFLAVYLSACCAHHLVSVQEPMLQCNSSHQVDRSYNFIHKGRAALFVNENLPLTTGPQEEYDTAEGRGSDGSDQGCPSCRFLQSLHATGLHSGSQTSQGGSEEPRDMPGGTWSS